MHICQTPPSLPESAPSSPQSNRTQPPNLIFAGAGTGKTTTITAKSAHMVEKENIDPTILALTFSREAARNMHEKVKKLLQEIVMDNAITNLFAGIRRKEFI